MPEPTNLEESTGAAARRFSDLLQATAEALHMPAGESLNAIPAAAAAAHDAAKNLRDQLDRASLGRQQLQGELDELAATLRRYRTVVQAAQEWRRTEDLPDYALDDQERALIAAVDNLAADDTDASEPTVSEVRRHLDRAIDVALPLAGGRVRKLLKALRLALAHVDAGRGAAALTTAGSGSSRRAQEPDVVPVGRYDGVWPPPRIVANLDRPVDLDLSSRGPDLWPAN